MDTKSIIERGLNVATEAVRPLQVMRQAAASGPSVEQGAPVTRSVGFETFVVAKGLHEIDTQDINAFDNRAHAVAALCPERAHEVAATQELVYELDTNRAALIGHQLLDIIIE